jgi:16S rRNA (uracil1498-N3)-methyltransferase
MRLHRFYLADFSPAIGTEFRIGFETGEGHEREEQLIHQWRDIFRMSKGDRVIIYNEKIGEWLAEFISLERKKGATLTWIEQDRVASTELGSLPQTKTTLYMAIIKNSNFDLVIEKATELGVTSIIPIKTNRTIKSGLNFDRLNKLAIEASEQSGRMDIPVIGEITELKDAITDAKKTNDTVFFGHITDKNIEAGVKSTTSKAIFIGPEGGWTDEEIEFFIKENVTPLALGQFVLRAETAAIVGVSKLV